MLKFISIIIDINKDVTQRLQNIKNKTITKEGYL